MNREQLTSPLTLEIDFGDSRISEASQGFRKRETLFSILGCRRSGRKRMEALLLHSRQASRRLHCNQSFREPARGGAAFDFRLRRVPEGALDYAVEPLGEN